MWIEPKLYHLAKDKDGKLHMLTGITGGTAPEVTTAKIADSFKEIEITNLKIRIFQKKSYMQEIVIVLDREDARTLQNHWGDRTPEIPLYDDDTIKKEIYGDGLLGEEAIEIKLDDDENGPPRRM